MSDQLSLGQRLAILWRQGRFHCEKDLTTGKTATFKDGERIESAHEKWLRGEREKADKEKAPQLKADS